MNIYQRIILVLGGIGLAYVLYMTLHKIYTQHESVTVVYEIRTGDVYAAFLRLKYDCILAIVKCAIVSALTFSGYIAFKSRK